MPSIPLYPTICCLLAATLLMAGCERDDASGASEQEASTTSSNEANKAHQTTDDAGEAREILTPRTEPPAWANAPKGGTLRLALPKAAMRYDPILASPDTVSFLNGIIQDPLASRDPQDSMVWRPGLAESIKRSADGRTFTVTLREGMTWHRPAFPEIDTPEYQWMREEYEVTADDVVFTLSLVFAPSIKLRPQVTGFEMMEDIKKVDEHTVRITWREPVDAALDHIASLRLKPKWLFGRQRDGSVIPDLALVKVYERHWAQGYPIGAGPYRITRSKRGEGVWLERSESYWGVAGRVDAIEVREFNDDEQRLSLLESGDVDMTQISALKRAEIERLKADATIHEVLFPTYYYIAYNTTKPLFQDPDVRRAMTLALERDEVLREAFESGYEPISGPFLPSHPGTDPDITPLPYDLARAAEVLEGAGWTDTDGDGLRDKEVEGERVQAAWTLVAFDRPTWEPVLSRWTRDLATIGVDLTVETAERPGREPVVARRAFDAYMGGWETGWANNLIEMWHSSRATDRRGLNRGGFTDEQVDELVMKLRKEVVAPDERVKLMRALHARLHDLQPYTFLFVPTYLWVVVDRVDGVTPSPVAPNLDPRSWSIPPEQRLPAVDVPTPE